VSITEHKLVSRGETPARRLEIFTGAGRRRAWTAHEKAAIVAESFEAGAVASHVARRHGLTPQQLFAWRRQACRRSEDDIGAPAFAPVVVEAPSAVAAPDDGGHSSVGEARPPVIELDVEGSSVWIWPGAEAGMVTAIIGALKAGK
jgi:transposase